MPDPVRRALLLGLAASLPFGAGRVLSQPAADGRFNPDELRFRALPAKGPGELNIGVLVDFPPYGTLDTQRRPDGYDADVARLLAKDWAVKVHLVPLSGGSRIPFLLDGKVDLLIASLAITPERAEKVRFSTPYSAATLVIYGQSRLAMKSVGDLKGYRIGVTRASTQDAALTAVAPAGTQLIRLFDDASAAQALLQGQVDAIGCSTTVASQIARRAPAGALEQKFVLRQQEMGIAVRPGQDALLQKVNAFVARNLSNGELNRLYRKWLDADLPAMHRETQGTS